MITRAQKPAPAVPTFPVGDAQWKAVLSRDKASDGRFVIGVTSTGIYCRPSCPARKPRRDRVRVFPQPRQAEEAGFRACLRCHPKEVSAADRTAEQMVRVCRQIESSLWERATLESLGRSAGMTGAHLQRVFKKTLGVSPRQYAEAHRVSRLKERLKSGDDVTTALYQAGYGSSSRLYESASGRLGMTPGTLRQGGRGSTIGYTTIVSPLGCLLVAATEKGICAVSIGNEEKALVRTLRSDYPQAHVHRDDKALKAWARGVRDLASGRGRSLHLPLDVQATAFQSRVWAALRAIPSGVTATYGEIAKAIGSPRAARAVGRACATNKAALVIPCHRAVGGTGSMVGYRWGKDRKRRLLELETAADVSRPARRVGSATKEATRGAKQPRRAD